MSNIEFDEHYPLNERFGLRVTVDDGHSEVIVYLHYKAETEDTVREIPLGALCSFVPPRLTKCWVSMIYQAGGLAVEQLELASYPNSQKQPSFCQGLDNLEPDLRSKINDLLVDGGLPFADDVFGDDAEALQDLLECIFDRWRELSKSLQENWPHAISRWTFPWAKDLPLSN